MIIKRMTLTLALVFVGAFSAAADTYTFTGKAPSPDNNLWSNPQNWSPSNNVPGAADTAIIGTNTTGFNVVVDSDVTVANLTMINSSLKVIQSFTVTGIFESQYNTLFGAGSVTVNGTMNMDLLTYIENGTTVLCPFTVNGSANVNSNAVMYIGSALAVVNNGNFTLANTASLSAVSQASAVFVNQGNFYGGNATVTMSGSGCLFSNAPAGTVTAQSGCKLQFSGTLGNSGKFSPAANGTNYVSGTAQLHDGAQFNGAGVTELVNAITLDGQVTSSGNLQLGDPSASLPVLTMNGLLNVPGGGTLTWLGGTIKNATNGTGTLQIGSGGTMVVNQANYMGIQGIILTNNGTVNCTNQGLIYIGYDSEIDNTGSFNLWNDGQWYLFSSGSTGYNVATFNNYGLLEKKLGATNSASIISVPMNSPVAGNGGIIQSDQGTLQLTGGGVLGSLQGRGQIKLSNTSYLAAPKAVIGRCIRFPTSI